LSDNQIHYIENLPQEGGDEKSMVTEDWPATGYIRASNLCLRYRQDLPLVLKEVTFDIPAAKKVGIVGRTGIVGLKAGAGKSTILSSLLRLFELESGSIRIDDVDISTISLNTLRSRIAVMYYNLKIDLKSRCCSLERSSSTLIPSLHTLILSSTKY
jgi:ATP-binding cassette, subfamily C (CFTR/MRP), member 1